MENLFKKNVVLICFLFMFFSVFAQNTFKVRGVVTDQNGEILLGATILEKGTSNATLTNENGEYELAISSPDKTLVYSYLGALSQELKVNNRTLINVSLQENQQLLDEVVVTALGISREKKALGYAVQDIKGSDMMVMCLIFHQPFPGKLQALP